MLSAWYDPRDWGVTSEDIGIGVLVPSFLVTKATKGAFDELCVTDEFQQYACAALKSEYIQNARQDAASSPNAKAQAASIAAQYAESCCTEPLPPASQTLPSGLPPALPEKVPGTHREFIRKPFYKKTGFWIGVGVVAAAGAGTYYILR